MQLTATGTRIIGPTDTGDIEIYKVYDICSTIGYSFHTFSVFVGPGQRSMC